VQWCGGCTGWAHQGRGPAEVSQLQAALVAPYCYAHGAEPSRCRRCALAVRAMGVFDPWVAAGRDINDPLLLQLRGSLVASHGAPWDAVARARQLLRVSSLELCLRN
jgi:hypothetical protein